MPISFTGNPNSTATGSTMPPFAEPSSFVRQTPVTSTASWNNRACWSPFCPARRVEDEQRLARRALQPALDDAAHLLQLLHQPDLRVETAGSVDDRDVVAVTPGQTQQGEINHHDGGRGLYFEDPNGHLLEIITRPYGSGGWNS